MATPPPVTPGFSAYRHALHPVILSDGRVRDEQATDAGLLVESPPADGRSVLWHVYGTRDINRITTHYVSTGQQRFIHLQGALS